MDKEDVVHIYNGILLSHYKEWNTAICNNTEGPRDYHTKWNKSDKERQISYHIAYMWNLKKIIQMNLFTKQRLTDLETSLITKEESEGKDRLGVWIDTYTLLYLK